MEGVAGPAGRWREAARGAAWQAAGGGTRGAAGPVLALRAGGGLAGKAGARPHRRPPQIRFFLFFMQIF